MNDEVRKAVEIIRSYLDELKDKNDSKLFQVKKEGYNDYDEAVANILHEMGVTPAELTDPMIWAAIKHKNSLLTKYQLAALFNLICDELKGKKLEGFEDSDHISGMVNSHGIFIYDGTNATIKDAIKTDMISASTLASKTIEKLHKSGHPEVCKRLSKVVRIGYAEYASLCDDLFGKTSNRKLYPFHQLQINIRNTGDHNLTSIINRIKEILRKTIPDPKNKRKLIQNVPVYVIATLEKDSQQKWKDTWYWLNEAKLLKEDDPLLRFTDYEDPIGNTLSSRYNSASYYFEDN